jgi:uncharacterized protein with PIN domain
VTEVRTIGTVGLSFRFYAQLNDFLPAARRYRRFHHRLPSPASVKDVIESLGVPHPEVDVIVVNGVPEQFAYRLDDGDQVAVYPCFTAIDVPAVTRVGAAPIHPIRFVVDVHLGKLASFLRLGGFDAVVMADDEAAAAISANDRRVLLTRDVGLLKRGIVTVGYWVRSTKPEEQLAEVLARYDLVDRIDPFSRCMRCNTSLIDANADAVAARILPGTREAFREFRECLQCGRIYWRGSHYEQLVAVLNRVRRRAIGRP